MKITTLIENTSLTKKLRSQHGLSLYIETTDHKILIDTGADHWFGENALKLGIDLKAVDIAIITHGHFDHGGGLKRFLEINHHAKIYCQKTAFDPTYHKLFLGLKYPIGLDQSLSNHHQIIKVNQDYEINPNLKLITTKIDNRINLPKGNKSLLIKRSGKYYLDQFDHEQSVIIKDQDTTVLIGGCAHQGIFNIINSAASKINQPIDYCLSGFHLKASNNDLVELENIAKLLGSTTIKYYTFHCTGLKGYQFLKSRLNDQIQYLATGQSIEI